MFEQTFTETFKQLAEGGRTLALRVQYHNVVDVIKIFIRTERLADYNGHLSCIVSKMIHIFAAAGQGCTVLSTLAGTRDFACLLTLERFTVNGNHVVCYSNHECLALGVTSALSRH